MTLKQSILTGSILLVSALPSHAASEINMLIQMLHENGMVSDEQYVRLQAELTQNQTQVLKVKEAMQKAATQFLSGELRVAEFDESIPF